MLQMYVLHPDGAPMRAVMAASFAQAEALLGACPDGIYSRNRPSDNSMVWDNPGVVFVRNADVIPSVWERAAG